MLASLEMGEKIPPTRPLDLRLSILRILLCPNHPWSHNQLLNLGKTIVHIHYWHCQGIWGPGLNHLLTPRQPLRNYCEIPGGIWVRIGKGLWTKNCPKCQLWFSAGRPDLVPRGRESANPAVLTLPKSVFRALPVSLQRHISSLKSLLLLTSNGYIVQY